MSVWKRENDLSDYVSTRTANGKKRWLYQGDLYCCRAVDERKWKRYRPVLLAFSLLDFALFVAASLVNPASMHIPGALYVLIPYALACLACIMGLARAIHLQFVPWKMERMDYDKCILSLRRYTVAITVLCGATGLAQLAYIIIQQAFSANEWLTALLCLAAAGINWISYRLQNRHVCQNIGKAPQTP